MGGSSFRSPTPGTGAGYGAPNVLRVSAAVAGGVGAFIAAAALCTPPQAFVLFRPNMSVASGTSPSAAPIPPWGASFGRKGHSGVRALSSVAHPTRPFIARPTTLPFHSRPRSRYNPAVYASDVWSYSTRFVISPGLILHLHTNADSRVRGSRDGYE